MEVMKNFHMNGGVDETSYSMNSSLQRNAILITMPIIEESLHDLLVSSTTKDDNRSKTFRIADFGCSSGPNTLFLVSNVVDIVRTKSHQLGYDLPEFLVFLNDLPTNDFNSIFESLPGYYNQLMESTTKYNGEDEGFGRCFVAGVPGSFYGRLFPRKSLNYALSSFSLHWLSQVPRGVEANKRSIYISKLSPPAIAEAYLKQFQSDFSMFLKARSKEIVHGGGMVLGLLGRRRKDSSSRECCHIYELIAIALSDMVNEGLIEEEKLNSFNLPVYRPSPMEVESAIEREGSFMINRVETYNVYWDNENGTSALDDLDKLQSSANVANCLRAVLEPLLVSHFGDDKGIMNELFRRYRESLEVLEDGVFKETTIHVNVVVSLKRK